MTDAFQVIAEDFLLDGFLPVVIDMLEHAAAAFTVFESALIAGKLPELARSCWTLLKNKYDRMDSRDSRGTPLPGISSESFSAEGHFEGTAKGAIGILLVIRYLFGFREVPRTKETVFELVPALPGELLRKGKKYPRWILAFNTPKASIP